MATVLVFLKLFASVCCQHMIFIQRFGLPPLAMNVSNTTTVYEVRQFIQNSCGVIPGNISFDRKPLSDNSCLHAEGIDCHSIIGFDRARIVILNGSVSVIKQNGDRRCIQISFPIAVGTYSFFGNAAIRIRESLANSAVVTMNDNNDSLPILFVLQNARQSSSVFENIHQMGSGCYIFNDNVKKIKFIDDCIMLSDVFDLKVSKRDAVTWYDMPLRVKSKISKVEGYGADFAVFIVDCARHGILYIAKWKSRKKFRYRTRSITIDQSSQCEKCCCFQ